VTERALAVAPWRCPVCRNRLSIRDGGRRFECREAHSFDVARAGYVHLLTSGLRRSRQPGDSAEMVTARQRFLATGAYDALSTTIAAVAGAEQPRVVLDVGCGEGRHTRAVPAALVLGIDIAKPAVAAAARAHPAGWYAVATAADVPLDDASVDVALNVFGPVTAAELGRVVRPGGMVIAAHPGPDHLEGLRLLVYPHARHHEVKPPLRAAGTWFTQIDSISVTFPVTASNAADLRDLFAMTPYRWHAPRDMQERIAAAVCPRFETVADVRISVYRRQRS
jgi:23S rRNA (guanine745-N1)-methyltransferase